MWSLKYTFSISETKERQLATRMMMMIVKRRLEDIEEDKFLQVNVNLDQLEEIMNIDCTTPVTLEEGYKIKEPLHVT